MKKVSLKIGSVLLTLVLLLSTLSVVINRHYCGGQLYSEALFAPAADCGMEAMNTCDLDNNTSQNFKNINCCQHVHIFVKGQNLEQKALASMALDIHQTAIIFNFKSFDFESDYVKQPVYYQDYSPPLLVKNIPVFVQSFRI